MLYYFRRDDEFTWQKVGRGALKSDRSADEKVDPAQMEVERKALSEQKRRSINFVIL